MTATEQVILVDEDDNPIGTAEKLAAHREGLCHRAFSIFIFKEHAKDAVLLQQRATSKYHSPGLWTNTCCSHPRPNEEVHAAAERRLVEEMGIKTPLTWKGRFHYIAHFDNGLTENEVDHVFVGTLRAGETFDLNPDEAQDYQWIDIPSLKAQLAAHPEQFTPWLSQALAVIAP